MKRTGPESYNQSTRTNTRSDATVSASGLHTNRAGGLQSLARGLGLPNPHLIRCGSGSVVGPRPIFGEADTWNETLDYRPRRDMEVTPPPNLPDAKRDVTQALYTLVMNVAEAASQGQMPTAGTDGLTYLACANIADTIVNLMNANPT